MIKVILFVIAVVLILYLGLRDDMAEKVSQPVKKEQRVQQDVLPEPEEEGQETAKTQVVQKEPQKTSASKVMPVSQEKYTASKDMDAEEDEEAEDETPSVRRSQLIGGADVEWIEPKPKDPNNKFGEPPM